jgi:hypothetical protein
MRCEILGKILLRAEILAVYSLIILEVGQHGGKLG